MTVGHDAPAALRAQVTVAVDRARRRLLELQNEGGTWGCAHTGGVGPDAEDLLFREFAGLGSTELTAATARWVRSRQHADGSWPNEEHGRGDLTVSIEAYCALRVAGDEPDDYHMAQAAGWIRDAGGLAAAGISTTIWLAMFGYEDWADLAVPPPEAVYLPAACPVRLPGHASWGRPTVVPLSVIAALRPRRALPFGLAELRVPVAGLPGRGQAAGRVPAARRVSALPGLDQGLRAYQQRLRIGPLDTARAAALRACAAWISAAQQPDGSWRASRSGWLFSLIALHLLGYAHEHPVMARGLAGLDRSAVWTEQPDGAVRRLEIGRPAIRDTALAVTALADAGLPPDHPALAAAGGWLLAEEVAARAAWLAGRHEPGSEGPAGGPGRGAQTGVADTAAVLLALRRVRLPAGSGQLTATVCSLRWLAGLQRKNGGWGRFAAGPGSSLLTRVPLFDIGDVRDPAGAELTGRVLQAVSAAGQPAATAIRRGITWLLRLQLPDGSWPGDQGIGDLPATCAALAALVAAGVIAAKPPVTMAVSWLLERQNSDGGWGHAVSRRDGQLAASGTSVPVPTARAVLSLLPLLAAGGEDLAAAVDRGVAWLARAQLPDGGWAESAARLDVLTGPLSTLGRYQAVTGSRSALTPRAEVRAR